MEMWLLERTAGAESCSILKRLEKMLLLLRPASLYPHLHASPPKSLESNTSPIVRPLQSRYLHFLQRSELISRLLQMTGLDTSRDTILSISCILTTSNLEPLDSAGFNAVIHHSAEQLSAMSEWCIQTHGASGLTQECLSSSTSAETAASQLLRYIQHFIPEPRRALLAGNRIHADRAFLMLQPWIPILEHLHYRLFDVSAMKEMVRRWAGEEVLMAAPRKELRHTAREDVLESIQEAQYYKGLIGGMALTTNRSSPVSAHPTAPPIDRFNAFDGTAAVLPTTGFPPSFYQPVMPRLGSREGHRDLDKSRQNGIRIGDVGTLDPGFRTDIA